MSTIRDESTRTLAEALSRRFGWSEGVATRNAEAVLSDSTLARRLDFATAWDEAGLPEALQWAFDTIAGSDDYHSYCATQGENGWAAACTCGAEEKMDTIKAALTAALRDRAR